MNWIALAWGFAEATVFFIVPDVWLTLAARKHLRPGLIASLYALFGALLGGTLMYLWGRADRSSANLVLDAIPAIDPEMIVRVADELSQDGVLALMLGPLSGTPYKVYAVQGADSSIGLGLFLLTSIPARLSRFLLVTLLAHYGLKSVGYWMPRTNPVLVLLVCWVFFYAYYFSVMLA